MTQLQITVPRDDTVPFAERIRETGEHTDQDAYCQDLTPKHQRRTDFQQK